MSPASGTSAPGAPSRDYQGPGAPLMTGSPDMRQAALWYAKTGIPVFPLHNPIRGGCSCGNRDCGSPGKHPRTPHGFKDATTDLLCIENWWSKWPEANIGIPTGPVTKLLVVDSDPRNGGPADREEFSRRIGPIPDTTEVLTGGGGRHDACKQPWTLRGRLAGWSGTPNLGSSGVISTQR